MQVGLSLPAWKLNEVTGAVQCRVLVQIWADMRSLWGYATHALGPSEVLQQTLVHV